VTVKTTAARPMGEPAGDRRRAKRPPRRRVDGVLLLDKPAGLTSNAALQRVKRLYAARKAGHTGALDPLATGMLPLCFGQATKMSQYMLQADKTYRVEIAFGTRTDTGDADGQVVEKAPVPDFSPADLEAALQGFRGETQQVPPMYSALKKDGRRLYELAREGKEVEREPRTIRISELAVEIFDARRPVLRVSCGKGTYVRTLAEDIAAALGTSGHVAALRRTSVGPFRETGMVTMAELEAAGEGGYGALDALLMPADEAVADWPEILLSRSEAWYLCQGHVVNAASTGTAGLVRLYDEGRSFLGVGEVLRDGRVAPKRLFGAQGPRRAVR